MSSATVTDSRIEPTDVALPARTVSLQQDDEWCLVRRDDDDWKRIRFHDYEEIYEIPGLYEVLFHDLLRCRSPEVVRRLLQVSMDEARMTPGDLRVLDLGAGNGLVGQQLANLGVRRLVGIDVLEEAATAAHRDRKGVYEEYFVCDMTQPSKVIRERLRSFNSNCLVCVAALGFGDIPPQAFLNAFNLIENGGRIVFNIKETFLESDDSTGFSRLIDDMIDAKTMSIQLERRYVHRLATNGDPLHYRAFVAAKSDSHIDPNSVFAPLEGKPQVF